MGSKPINLSASHYFQPDHSHTYIASLCSALGIAASPVVGSRLHGLFRALDELATIVVSLSLIVLLTVNLQRSRRGEAMRDGGTARLLMNRSNDALPLLDEFVELRISIFAAYGLLNN